MHNSHLALVLSCVATPADNTLVTE